MIVRMGAVRMGATDAASEIVVVTGASGRIGRRVVPLLRRPGRVLRLVDLEVPEDAVAASDDLALGAIEWQRASIEDDEAIGRAVDGADAVVHLAALASERPWADLLRVNIDGTQKVLEAARTAGVGRVFLASSVHAVGFADVADAAQDQPLLPRPDTYYGVSKAAVEALGSLYADRFGMSVVTARICHFAPDPGPSGTLGLSLVQWFSVDDAVRLIEAALAVDDGRHHLVWGVSANAPARFSLAAGRAIGYEPQDDAVRVATLRDGAAPAIPAPAGPLGGMFTDEAHPVGGTW
jgi:nucleoside-diphosphate-sugar epimerase